MIATEKFKADIFTPGADNQWNTADDVTVQPLAAGQLCGTTAGSGSNPAGHLAGTFTAASTVNNPYLFTGRRLDAESGLYYFRARYHDPNLGRFISRDPMQYVDGHSLYAAYFAQNFMTDPTGEGAVSGGLIKAAETAIALMPDGEGDVTWQLHKLPGIVSNRTLDKNEKLVWKKTVIEFQFYDGPMWAVTGPGVQFGWQFSYWWSNKGDIRDLFMKVNGKVEDGPGWSMKVSVNLNWASGDEKASRNFAKGKFFNYAAPKNVNILDKLGSAYDIETSYVVSPCWGENYTFTSTWRIYGKPLLHRKSVFATRDSKFDTETLTQANFDA